MLGAIFHRSTFERALRFLAEQEQREEEGGAEATAKGGSSAFGGLVRTLQVEGYIVKAARGALIGLRVGTPHSSDQ